MRRKPRSLSRFEVSVAACSAPVRTATVLGSAARMRVRSSRGVTPGCGCDVELVVAPDLARHPLRLLRDQKRNAGAAEGLSAREPEDAHDRVARGGAGARHDHRLAQLQGGSFGGRLVDRDLAGGPRQAPGDGLERLEAHRHLGSDERRSATAAQALAMHVQQAAGGEDRARRLRDPRRRTHPREHRFVDRRDFRAYPVAEVLRGGDDHRLGFIGRVEDARERVVDGVGEDVGAGHQRDPQRDRDGRQQHAQLALHEAPQHQREHQPRRRPINPAPSSGREPHQASPRRRHARSSRPRAPAAGRQTRPRGRRG